MARQREEYPVGGRCYLKTRYSYGRSGTSTVQKRRSATVVSVSSTGIVVRTHDNGKESTWPLNMVEPDEDYLAEQDRLERYKHAKLRRDAQLPEQLHLVTPPLTVALGEALKQKANDMPPRKRADTFKLRTPTQVAPAPAPVQPINRSTGQPVPRSLAEQVAYLRREAERIRAPLREECKTLERAVMNLESQLATITRELDAKRAEFHESAKLLREIEGMGSTPARPQPVADAAE